MDKPGLCFCNECGRYFNTLKQKVEYNLKQDRSITKGFEMTEKYVPLEYYLRKLPISQQEVTITFDQIEGILNDRLPLSAHEHRSWWGNQKQGTHVEAIAWMDAGWLVETVDLKEMWVKFVRQ